MNVSDSFWIRLGDWLTDPETWWGAGGVVHMLREHLFVSIVASALAIALAFPPAAWLGHRRQGKLVAVLVAGSGRSIPSLGIIVLSAMAFLRAGQSATFWPITIALVLLAIPPLFTNTWTAIAEVDRSVVDAAHGMGFTSRQLFRDVELPLAMPVILEGLRLAIVQVVATVTLGALVGPGGGLGQLLIRGFSSVRTGGDVLLVAGAVSVTALTLMTDWGSARALRVLVPPGVQQLSASPADQSDAAITAAHG